MAYWALRDIGCLRPGQRGSLMSTDILNDIRDAANQMIDAWRIDDLMAYAYPAAIYTLVAQLEQYQIGPGQVAPNFDAPRPTGIADANVIINFTTTPTVRKPLTLWGKDEWANIRVRATPPGTTAPISAIPDGLYYDGDFDPTSGFATINLWPAPQYQPQQLELFTSQTMPFASFADLTTVYAFPPAYERAMRKCLAVEIAPSMQFSNKLARLQNMLPVSMQMLAKVEQQAIDAKALIMSDNAPDAIKTCDPAFLGSSRRGGWVYATGDYGRGGT